MNTCTLYTKIKIIVVYMYIYMYVVLCDGAYRHMYMNTGFVGTRMHVIMCILDGFGSILGLCWTKVYTQRKEKRERYVPRGKGGREGGTEWSPFYDLSV